MKRRNILSLGAVTSWTSLAYAQQTGRTYKLGWLSPGVRRTEVWRAAERVAAVLKGSKPADLPVGQSSVIERVVNLRSAQALGVVLPQGTLLRANRVIE